MSALGGKIDALYKLRETKREFEERIKAVQQEMGVLEQELIELMNAEGVSKVTGRLATAAVSTSVKPTVKDWDAFYAFIGRHKYYHLLERRPSVTGCRELFETKGKIPGVEPYTAQVLRLTTLNEVP